MPVLPAALLGTGPDPGWRPAYRRVWCSFRRCRRIVSEEPPPLRDVPGAVEAVIRRAMDRAPQARYATAADLLIALRGLQRDLGMPVTEVPGGPVPEAPVPEAPGAAAAERGAADAAAGAAAEGEAATGLGQLAGLPPIAPTQWEFAEKTGYRTGHQPPARSPHDAAGGIAAGGWSPDDDATDPGAVARPAVAVRKERRTATIAAAAALVVVAVAVPLLLAGMRHGTPRPGPSGSVTASATTSGPQPQSSPPVSAPPNAVVAHAAPVGLTVTIAGPIATLRWRLEPGNPFPLVVDEPQSLGTQLVSLGIGSTSYTVVGIHAGIRYCFKVGALTETSPTSPVFAWSSVACANGSA